MTTALDLITTALQEIQVYAPGETLDADDSARGLSVLNAMLDSWSNESLACYAILEQSAALVVGQNQYTIGTGGSFNMTRPLRILDGPGAAYLQDSNLNNYPVDVVPRDQWNLIGSRATTITSNIPNTLFYDPQYPLGVINLFPTPNISYNLFWDSYLQISEFATLTTVISMPPGYRPAIEHNLAVWLKPYFKTAQLDPDIKELARDTKAAVKRTNNRPNVSVYDPEIISRTSPTYNIYTDSSNGRTG